MLRAESIASRLKEKNQDDPFMIAPPPGLSEVEQSGSASLDLRLGCWFTSLKKESVAMLAAYDDTKELTDRLCEEQYVMFGNSYILHPHSFVLAVTLEWIKMPKNLAGYIHGKSSWGRRGLIIATAAVIHPGFTGCITLELTNLGEVPISIMPGMRIAQLCLHDSPNTGVHKVDKSSFKGHRKPILGAVKTDLFSSKMMEDLRIQDSIGFIPAKI